MVGRLECCGGLQGTHRPGLPLPAWQTPLPWQALEQVPDFLRGRGWVLIGSSYSIDGTPGSLDAHPKTFLKTATAGWIAVVLEKARVITVDRTRPRASSNVRAGSRRASQKDPICAAGPMSSTDRIPAHNSGYRPCLELRLVTVRRPWPAICICTAVRRAIGADRFGLDRGWEVMPGEAGQVFSASIMALVTS